jgi:hypothetical protein
MSLILELWLFHILGWRDGCWEFGDGEIIVYRLSVGDNMIGVW